MTVRDLVVDRALGLRVLAGAEALDRDVAWVHVSELADPTPFLDGGELLLTTGLIVDQHADFAESVGRLVECGVAALGFGVGLSHESVPGGLLRAAEGAGLPLLEVSRSTPFLAISKAVSRTLAADAYAEVTTTNAAQRALTKAALGKAGQAGLVRRLAQLLDAWVLLLDSAGEPVHAAPASAARRLPDVSAEVDRLRAHPGPGSAAFAAGGDQVSVQALGSRPRAFLGVGRPGRLDRADQHVLNSAAALLTLVLTRSQAQEKAQRRLRTGLMRLILAGQSESARRPAEDLWGPLPPAPLRVLAAAGPSAARDGLFDLLQAGRVPCYFAELAERVVVLLAEDGDDLGAFERLARTLPELRVGISEPVDYGTVADGHRQAVQSVAAADRIGTSVVRFAELAGRGLLKLLRPSDAEAFAESMLGPLIRHDAAGRGDLVASLREWLGQHGQWDPAASRLGVHRHTLRNRMGKVEELIGASLDSPGVRAELWLALRLVDPS